MDYIKIVNLKANANHGVYPWEKEKGQTFLISATLTLDLQPAGLDDDLGATINYGLLCDEIIAVFSEKSFDLIEAAGEHLALWILSKYKIIQTISLEIKKPEAPIEHYLDYPAIAITRSRHQVFIGFGSNLGDRQQYINAGLKALSDHPQIEIAKTSTMIETPPWGLENQPSFLNGVVEIDTTLNPEVLLATLLGIEAAAGRKREAKWGPRTLDLDILFYDDLITYTKNLNIPHPYIPERDFVLIPLAEIAPNFVHPVLGKTMTQLLAEFKSQN